MPDLWGPGAFGAADPSATRPAYSPANGVSDPDTWYKDCSSPAEDDGTQWVAAALNAMLAQMRAIARKSGLTVSNLDDNLAMRAIRSGGFNYRQATGTPNAIAIALDPAPSAFAELLGMPLRIRTSAANTGAVTLAVGALAATPVKGADGLDLLAGELPSDMIFEVAYNGAFFQIINRPVPAAQRAPSAFIMTTTSGQSIAISTQTVVNWFAPVNNDTLDSVLAANQITIGPKDAGWWAIVGKLFYDFPASGTMESNIIIERNGSEISAGNAYGSTGIRARPSATAIYKLAAGDIIRLTTATTVSRNLTISGGTSIFAGFKIGA